MPPIHPPLSYLHPQRQYPTIPFYRYKSVWMKHAKELKAMGTPMTNYIGPLKNSNKKK